MYHIEKGTGDIVIDGWEAGIADAPGKGIAMMRNINLISIPGEGAVNFKTTAINVPTTTLTGQSCTFTASTDVVTWTGASGLLYTDTAITFGSTSGGVTAGTVYWISNVQDGSPNSFKVYADIGRSTLIDLTADGSNTFTVIQFGQPTHKTLDNINNWVFFLDANGRAWWVNESGNLTFLGNTTLTNAHGNGLVLNGDFLYVFRDAAIDYLPTTYLTSSSAPAWTYGWKTANLGVSAASNNSHYALVAQDAAIYFCNNKFVGAIRAATAGVAIDPSNASTYTYNAQALPVPSVDSTTCLAELGSTLLVGGVQNKIYPWDRVSPLYNYPLILSENYTTRMVSTNSSTYIFAGNRGRIYITNGSNLNLFKKIPDHITLDFGGSLDPYFTWLDAIYWKNQIYFSFSTAKNDGTSITNLGGVWGLDISMNIMGTPTSVALRMTNTLSGGAALYPYVIAPNIRSSTPAGAGLYIGWSSATVTSYGVDVTSSTPYNSLSAVGAEIYSDLIPTGTAIDPLTFRQIEWKLASPLVNGETVRVSARQDYGSSWATYVVGTTTATATANLVLSDNYPVNFQKGQWIQLLVELFSTGTTPSYVRLKELRIKK